MLASVISGEEPAVNFGKDGFWFRVAFVIHLVIPGEVLQWSVTRVGGVCDFFSDAFGQGIEEIQFALALSGRGDCLMSPLHQDRKSTRLNSSHVARSYAVFCLKKTRKP